MVVVYDWGGAKGMSASWIQGFCGDENALELDRGDGWATL